MTGEEIVDKLKKAGINASLVSRVHDQYIVNLDMPFEELELKFIAHYAKMDAETTLALSENLPLENCTYVDTSNMEMSLESYLTRVRPTKPEPVIIDYLPRSDRNEWNTMFETFIQQTKRQGNSLKHLATKYGYLEAPNGTRRHFSKGDMDSND